MNINLHKTEIKLTIPRVFYITNEIQLIQCSLLLLALYIFRAVFPPIIRSLKTVCAALGIAML